MMCALMVFSFMMMRTFHSGILYFSSQVIFGYLHHRALTAPDNRNATSRELGQCTGPHVSSQHHRHSVGLQLGRDIRLAATSLRRRKHLRTCDAVLFVHRKNRIKLTMTEMAVYYPVPGR